MVETHRGCFEDQVRSRDEGRCVICGEPAHVVLELMDCRLWDEGALFPDNGATLCTRHAEESLSAHIDLETLRSAARLAAAVPPHLYSMQRYDRWGNPILKDGRRARGELFYEPDIYQELKNAGLLSTFTEWVKYPRTFLLPWSEKTNEGERSLASMTEFTGKRVVVTEKMDGENVTLYRNFIHVRGDTPANHFSRSWLDEYWSGLRYQIPSGWRVCGEYLYARHTVSYDGLPSYFLGISVWNDRNICLGWDASRRFLESLGISMVPIIYDGAYDEARVRALWDSNGGQHSEGYVLRSADEISYRKFRCLVGKFVRKGYSQSNPIMRNIESGEPIGINTLA